MGPLSLRFHVYSIIYDFFVCKHSLEWVWESGVGISGKKNSRERVIEIIVEFKWMVWM